MIITPHILAGAAIGSRVHNYWEVAILALLSHYVLDLIPHCEYDEAVKLREAGKEKLIGHFLKIAIDFLSGIFIIILFSGNLYDYGYVLTGMFFGILPDILSYSRYVVSFKFLDYHYKFHKLLHFWKKKNIPDWIKISTQVAISLIAIWIIK